MFQQTIHIVWVDGMHLRVLAIDKPSIDQLHQGLFERERTFVLGHGDFLMQMLQRVTPDMLARAVADNQ